MPGADRSLEPLITFFSSAQPVIIIFLCLLSLLLCSNKVLVLQRYLRMSDLQDRCPKGCAATKAGDSSSWILMGCCQFHKRSAFSCWSDENFQAWGSWWQRKAGVLLPREVLVGWMEWEEMDLAYRISLDHSCCRVHVAKSRVWWLWKIFLYFTFHFMNCGCGTPGKHSPVGRFYLTLPGSPWLQLPSSPALSLSSQSSWISVWGQEHPWHRHHSSSSPGLLLVGSTLFGNSPHSWAAFAYPELSGEWWKLLLRWFQPRNTLGRGHLPFLDPGLPQAANFSSSRAEGLFFITFQPWCSINTQGLTLEHPNQYLLGSVLHRK